MVAWRHADSLPRTELLIVEQLELNWERAALGAVAGAVEAWRA